MKKTILLLATGFVFLNMTAQKPTPLYLDDNQPIEKRIENALSLMTLDEKIGQLNLPGAGDIITGQASNSDIAKKIKEGSVGGLLI